MTKAINILKKQVLHDAQHIPDFIDNKSETMKIIWDHIKFIFQNIQRLITDDFLSKQKLTNIARKVLESIMSLLNYSGTTLYQVVILPYLLQRLDTYKMLAEQEELYESLSNLIEFEKLFTIDE